MATHRWRLVVIVAVALTFTTCSPTADSSASKAQRALDAQQYSEAIATSEAGLAELRGDPKEKRIIWRLERIRVEALARSGDADGVLTTLERLVDTFPTQVNAPLFLALAQNIFEGGDRAAAERLLARGAQRFPREESLFSELATSWKHGEAISPEACERLRSLGYLDC